MPDAKSTNLWPDFDFSQTAPKSPKEVLREAGAGLREKTKDLIQWNLMRTQVLNDSIELAFSFWVPSIGFHYPFLTATFPITTLYPVKLVVDKFPAPSAANDEDELIAALGRAFNADSTKATIQRLISISR